ncbi:MAG: UxaA family hydrolase, partial [Lachnospiraceae bacterium]
MQDYIIINENDNVAVALKPLSAGTVFEIGGQQVTLAEDIPQGHKFALLSL